MAANAPVLPKLVGERVKRREDPRLIQGRGTYVDDVKIAGMLHMATHRAFMANHRVGSVIGGLCGDDLSRRALRHYLWRVVTPRATASSVLHLLRRDQADTALVGVGA